jgi:hypothetical protein
MPQVRFEPTNPMFEWAQTVLSLDRAATVIGLQLAHTGQFRVENVNESFDSSPSLSYTNFFFKEMK